MTKAILQCLLALLILGSPVEASPGHNGAAMPFDCNAATAAGSDIGAKINSCIKTLGGAGMVYVPRGTYYFNTTVVVDQNGVTIRGSGQGSTMLNYTASGTALDLNTSSVITRSGLYDIGVRVNNSSATAVKAGGLYQTIENVYISGTSAKLLYLTGNSLSSTTSFGTHLINVDLESFANIGLIVDHSVDVYVDQLRSVGNQNNITSQDIVIDSGVSGFYLSNSTAGYGLHNLLVENSAGGHTYGYNASPQFLFFTNFVGDSATGGDSILFDSTLGSNFVSTTFSNSWSASAGRDGVSCITNTANGIHIAGGGTINFSDHRILANCANGVLVDSASNPQNIHFSGAGCNVFDNNQANNSDAHGIYFRSPGNQITVADCTIGNGLQMAGGHQKYGVKAGAYAINNFKLALTDLTFNETGPLLNQITGAIYPSVILGNTPTSVGGGLPETLSATAPASYNRSLPKMTGQAPPSQGGGSNTMTWTMPTKPANSWTLPILGSTGVSFRSRPGVALRTAFEIPSGGVEFSTISVVVITADPNESDHYAVQIAGVDGDLLCSVPAGIPLTSVGTVAFQCSEGRVNLPQGIYTLVLSSTLVGPREGMSQRDRAVGGYKSPLYEPFSSPTAALLGVKAQFLTPYFNGSEAVTIIDGAVTGPLASARLSSGVLGDVPAFYLH